MCSFDINFLLYEIESFIYCGIIIMIVRGGPMFVAYVDNPSPQSYIPTKLYIHNHLFNTYENHPDYTTSEITSHEPGKIVVTHETQRINDHKVSCC